MMITSLGCCYRYSVSTPHNHNFCGSCKVWGMIGEDEMEDGGSMVLGGGRGWLGVFWRKFLSVMEVDHLKAHSKV